MDNCLPWPLTLSGRFKAIILGLQMPMLHACSTPEEASGLGWDCSTQGPLTQGSCLSD